jgi:hypothetical protein
VDITSKGGDVHMENPLSFSLLYYPGGAIIGCAGGPVVSILSSQFMVIFISIHLLYRKT